MEEEAQIKDRRSLPCWQLLKDQSAGILLRQCHAEIERAVDNLKRRAWDKSFRREWYRAQARSRWSAKRRFVWTRANRLQGGKRRTRK